MPQERLKEVLEILSRYNPNQSVVDYYQLFNFNKNMTVDEIKAQIKAKRLQVLFHPDQINFVPNEYHTKYLQMIETVKDVVNTFDNFQNKEAYDIKLKESEMHQENNRNQENYYQNSNSYYYQKYNNNQNNSWEDKTEDLEEVKFQEAIIINSEKYGFEYTRNSILKIINSNSVSGFTRDNNARGMVASISKDKIMSFLIKSSQYDDPRNITTNDQIVMNYLTDFIYNTSTLKQQADYLEQASNATIMKYDLNGHYGQTNRALENFYNNGDAIGFTNTNNARINLKNNVNYKDTKFFMQCYLNRKRHEDYKYAYQNTEKFGMYAVTTMYSEELIRAIKNKDNSEYGGGYNR